jgi:hypothetical protein
MKKEQIFGVIRHGLTFIAGILVTKGLIDDASSTELIGSIMGLVGLVWSITSKKVA